MDELISRHWKRRTSPDEEWALQAWRDASDRNERYYQELIRLLELAATVENSGRILQPPAAALIHLAEAGTAEESASSSPGWKRRWLIPVLATAAGLILVLGATQQLRRSGAPDIRLGAGEFHTGPGENATVTLGDGTVVRLAPASRLRVEDVPGQRLVHLDGKAYFAVAPMEGLPFRVRTRAGEAAALSTRFEVKVDGTDDDLRVVVVEGRVAVIAAGRRVELNAGHMSTVSAGAVSPPVKIDFQPMVAWVGQFMAFHATPLRQVVEELEREYGARVVLTDSALARVTVTGWYLDRSFEEVVAIVCGVVSARCSIEDGTATMSPADAGIGKASRSASGERRWIP
ncbi:MAG: FecR family protein [Longimicrobiales bacterium]